MILHVRFLQHLAEFIAILHLLIQGQVLCDGRSNSQCINREAEALLQFKKSLMVPSNRLSSWSPGYHCCRWKGVGCNTSTGHVISLDLNCANCIDKLQGDQLSSSLLQLPYLSSLNLGGNDFMQSEVPAFLGTMKNLKHLDLSNSNFKGKLPDENLGNLSLLESLDLSGKDNCLKADDLKWLHGLSSLKHLDLSETDLSNSANDWFLDIGMLPSLSTLRLSGCQLHNLPHSPPEVNFNSLTTLDLSFNDFNDIIPDWLFENCHNLQHLKLSNNQLQGPIPESIGMLMSLVTLDLSDNELIGSIPSTLGQAHGESRVATKSCLKELRLSNNKLNGSLERSIEQLSKLAVLDLARNKLEGNITDAHLANFNSLGVLDLSFNLLTLKVNKNWVPPFQLKTIGLGNCQLGPQFPKWFQTQKNFSYVDISNAGISDAVPDWFWNLSPIIESMNLSSNKLRGCKFDFSTKFILQTLDLSSNSFSCPLPHLPPSLRTLNLAKNSFYGNISNVCETLGVNNSLSFLDLSSNNLSRNIPNCWTYGENMNILNLGNNSLSGSIPDSLGSLKSLHMLMMYGNGLSGKFPDILKNCQVLTFLDLGNNRFGGPIPSWIGEEMRILKVLILRENLFEENIPTTLCMLKSLSILDLSNNQLSGVIPRCVFAAMATNESINDLSYMEYQTIQGSLSMYQSRFRSTHTSMILMGDERWMNSWMLYLFLKILDLSSNFLIEDIPLEITELVELLVLNLSQNQLVGSIPSGMGEMFKLEALDLSKNQLSCVIPNSIVNLNFLEFFNVSYNNLSGKIPSGYQFNTFDNSSYEGNPHLCGFPVTEKCSTNISFEYMHCSDREGNREHEDKRVGLGISSFYISMAVGFFTGFWIFWGSLILFTSWRYAYFRFLDNANDWIYVTVAIALAKFRRKFMHQHQHQHVSLQPQSLQY